MRHFKLLIIPILLFYISCKEQNENTSENIIEQKIKTEDVLYNIN